MLDVTFGTTVEIRVTDVHGNQNLVVGLERSNLMGHLAGAIADTTLKHISPQWSFRLALWSGIMANLGDTFKNIRELWELVTEPDTVEQIIDGLQDAWEVLSDTQMWPQLVD